MQSIFVFCSLLSDSLCPVFKHFLQTEALEGDRCWDFPPGQDFKEYHWSFDEVASTEKQELISVLFWITSFLPGKKKKKNKPCCKSVLFSSDFKSFQEESFSKLAHLDTTARSTESKKKKKVLFKESLCIVNRIKGDGKRHLSLSWCVPRSFLCSIYREKGFHIHCSLRNSQLGIFSIKQFTDMRCSNSHHCAPHPIWLVVCLAAPKGWILVQSPLFCV